MNPATNSERPAARSNHALPAWPILLKKLGIWALFLAFLYVTRDFFFTGFMTFMFCFLALKVVGWALNRLSPGKERRGIRALLTIGIFALMVMIVALPCALLIPHFIPEGERLVDWISHVSPDAEVAKVVEGIVGPFQLRHAYGDFNDPKYRKGLEEFRRQHESRGETPDNLLGDAEARLRVEFESVKRHEIFQSWWNQSPTARMIRHHVQASLNDGSDLAAWAEQTVSSFLDVPLGLATALLLSFFICIDFPRLQSGIRRLREGWTRDAYDEIVPALNDLGQLIGRSMMAQGLVAVCNALMMFIALTAIGVGHEVVLSLAVFVLCLVPTFGAIIAWFMITLTALFEPGGGPMLALKVTGAFAFVGFMESFVLGPRIVGRVMEIHPVLIIGILPVAQYFFGIWGMILATPVAVFVIHRVLLGQPVPGIDRSVAQPPI